MRTLTEIVESLQPGQRHVADGLPEKAYHAAPGIGSSAMKAATISMGHYKAYLERDQSFSPQQEKNFRIGSATHCLVLEPELFEEKFIVQPEDIKKRVGDKWKEFQRQNSGKTILMRDEDSTASATAEAVIDSPAIKYFAKGKAEQSIWFKHESGLLLKARLDYHVGDLGVDLKTTVKETANKFDNWIKYEYAIQDALYRTVADIKDFIFVGALKSSPHCAFLTKQGMLVRQLANQRINAAIRNLKTAMEFDDYPTPPVEMTETTLTQKERELLEA